MSKVSQMRELIRVVQDGAGKDEFLHVANELGIEPEITKALWREVFSSKIGLGHEELGSF